MNTTQDDENNDSSALVTKAIRKDIDDASRAYSFDKQVVCDHLFFFFFFFQKNTTTH